MLRNRKMWPITSQKTTSANRPRNGTNDGIVEKDVKTAIINLLSLFKEIKENMNMRREKGIKKTHIKLVAVHSNLINCSICLYWQRNEEERGYREDGVSWCGALGSSQAVISSHVLGTYYVPRVLSSILHGLSFNPRDSPSWYCILVLWMGIQGAPVSHLVFFLYST